MMGDNEDEGGRREIKVSAAVLQDKESAYRQLAKAVRTGDAFAAERVLYALEAAGVELRSAVSRRTGGTVRILQTGSERHPAAGASPLCLPSLLTIRACSRKS